MTDEITLEIMAAARAVCAQLGFRADVKSIAQRAGVAEATIYRRFPTRVALLDALTDEIITGVEQQVVTLAPLLEDDPVEVVRSVNRLGAEYVKSYGRLCSDIAFGDIPADLSAHRRRVGVLYSYMGNTIRRGIELEVFRKDLSPRLAVWAWRSMVSTHALEVLRSDGGVVEPEEMAQTISEFLLSAWCAR